MREEQNLKTAQAVNSDPVELHVGSKEIWLAKKTSGKLIKQWISLFSLQYFDWPDQSS